MLRATLFALALCLPSLARAQEVGDPAPDLKADHWYNWIGDGPTIEGLRGRTILLHFFLVKEPEKNAFLALCKFHEEYADKGLVILAVGAEAKGVVGRLLDDYPLPFPVGAGSGAKEAFGIKGERGQVLIDPSGNIFFKADLANGVWNGKLMAALKGSKRLGEHGTLAYRPQVEYSKRWRSTLDDLAAGELSSALKKIEKITENEKSDEGDVLEGTDLRAEVQAHVIHLRSQIEAELERGEARLAQDALDVLAKDLKRHPFGEEPLARLAELEGDGDHQKELEASDEYENLISNFWVRGFTKNKAKFEDLIDTYAGTHSAAKAEDWMTLILTRKF